MLTIGRLASYAGVTVRAVRHYHQIGLLPEPERTGSGYRTYDAAAVVRLIQIRILADAGVPLARVQDLLEAGPEEFAVASGRSTKTCAPRSGGCRPTASASPGSPPESTWRSPERRGLPRPAARPRRCRALHRSGARQPGS